MKKPDHRKIEWGVHTADPEWDERDYRWVAKSKEFDTHESAPPHFKSHLWFSSPLSNLNEIPNSFLYHPIRGEDEVFDGGGSLAFYGSVSPGRFGRSRTIIIEFIIPPYLLNETLNGNVIPIRDNWTVFDDGNASRKLKCATNLIDEYIIDKDTNRAFCFNGSSHTPKELPQLDVNFNFKGLTLKDHPDLVERISYLDNINPRNLKIELYNAMHGDYVKFTSRTSKKQLYLLWESLPKEIRTKRSFIGFCSKSMVDFVESSGSKYNLQIRRDLKDTNIVTTIPDHFEEDVERVANSLIKAGEKIRTQPLNEFPLEDILKNYNTFHEGINQSPL